MKKIKIIFLLFLFTQCNPFCKKKLDIVVVSITKGDEIEVVVDDGNEKYKEISEVDKDSDFDREDAIISNYCNGTDSVKLEVKLNDLDSTFYINTQQVRRVFIGMNISKNRLYVLHAFTNGTSNFVRD